MDDLEILLRAVGAMKAKDARARDNASAILKSPDDLLLIGRYDVTAFVKSLVLAGGNLEPDETRASHYLDSGRAEAKRIGGELHDLGGFDLMLVIHDCLAQNFLTHGAAHELSAAWCGVGDWLH